MLGVACLEISIFTSEADLNKVEWNLTMNELLSRGFMDSTLNNL